MFKVKNTDLKQRVIFTYSTKHLLSKDKVRFHYALKGRNGNPGFLQQINGMHLSSGALFIPKNFEQKVVEFMDSWEIPFSTLDVFTKKSASTKITEKNEIKIRTNDKIATKKLNTKLKQQKND